MKNVFRISLILVAGFAGASSAEVLNRVVASVNGEPVTAYQLDQFIETRVSQMPLPQRPSRRQALEALITDRLVASEIEAKGIVVGDEEIERYVERIAEGNKMNAAQFKEAIARQGMTWEEYRDQVRDEIQKMQLINREIRGRVNVTPEEVERHYRAVRDERYKRPAQVRLRHIVLRLSPMAPDAVVEVAQERIEAIRDRIVDEGETFEDVAKEVSEDAAAADGGLLGEVRPDQVLPEFEEAIAELDEGEVSSPVRTDSGLHLLRIDERIDSGYEPLEDVADELREELYSKTLDERYRRWLQQDLWERHYVEIHLDAKERADDGADDDGEA